MAPCGAVSASKSISQALDCAWAPACIALGILLTCVDDGMDYCSALGPEALLEALLAKKLTSSMLVEAGKGMAQKWIKDKTAPKESLLAAFGAEDHGLVVRLLLFYVFYVCPCALVSTQSDARYIRQHHSSGLACRNTGMLHD